MKRIVFQIIAVMSVFLFSCKEDPNKFHITGKITNPETDIIVLEQIKPDGLAVYDSIKVNSLGEFEYESTLPFPGFFLFKLNENKVNHLLIHPGDNMAVYTDATDFYNSFNVQGSPESLNIIEINKRFNYVLFQIDSLGEVYRANIENRRLDTVKNNLDNYYEKITTDYKNFVVHHIKENPGSLVNLMLFSQQFNERKYVLSTKDDFQLFKLVDTTLYSLYPESDFVLSLHHKVAELNEMFRIMENNQKMLGIGKEAPEIHLENSMGEDFLLSSIKSKLILLTFSATWSQESKDDLKYLKELRNTYKNYDLEIVQFMVDQSKSSWESYVEKDSIDWHCVSDLKFWDSPIVTAYNVTSIPANFLIDRKGIIIAKDIRKEKLIAEIKKVLKK